MKAETKRSKRINYKFVRPYRMVFSSWIYLAIAIVSASLFWILFSVFDQLLFFSPIFIFYLPPDAILGFVIFTINSVLLGIVLSLNVYILRNSRSKLSKSFISGSSIGVISSTCASCSSFGFLLASTFGASGILFSNFLTNYQIPLRLLSLALLLCALYFATRSINRICTVIPSK